MHKDLCNNRNAPPTDPSSQRLLSLMTSFPTDFGLPHKRKHASRVVTPSGASVPYPSHVSCKALANGIYAAGPSRASDQPWRYNRQCQWHCAKQRRSKSQTRNRCHYQNSSSATGSAAARPAGPPVQAIPRRPSEWETPLTRRRCVAPPPDASDAGIAQAAQPPRHARCRLRLLHDSLLPSLLLMRALGQPFLSWPTVTFKFEFRSESFAARPSRLRVAGGPF